MEQGAAPPVLLEVRRSRRGEMRVRVRTPTADAPGSEAPEAFWIGFYNSVSDTLFPVSSDWRSRRRGPADVADPLIRMGLLCEKQARELSGWDADSLSRRVDADTAQAEQLKEIGQVARVAAASLGRACAHAAGDTALWRLDVLLHRVKAMQQAADAVQPPLARFVEGLRPEQKERFSAMPARPDRSPADQERAVVFCNILVPPDRVAAAAHKVVRMTRPRPEQAHLFRAVGTAMAESQRLLHESCTVERAGDALAQLDVMRRRLQLSAEAIESVHTTVGALYASLDHRQRRSVARLGFGGETRAQALR